MTDIGENVIIVKLNGGLGNQMFQYAFGRHVAAVTNMELFLDPNGLSDPGSNLTPREFELGIFEGISARVLQANQLKMLRRGVPFTVWYTEGQFGFHEQIIRMLDFPAIGLDGYWQSEKYFKPTENVIRREFQFCETLEKTDALALICESESVCVHVRRQDYLTSVGAHFGFVGLDYYDRAVRIILQRLTDPTFIVFSDDIDWCSANLHFKGRHMFVESIPGQPPGATLNMMRQCRHFIIPNSSFSWWAAWLSTNPGKQVIAPKRWFARESLQGTKRQFSSSHIIPDDWMRI